MTKKHFEAIAALIRKNAATGSLQDLEKMERFALDLCIVFKKYSPRFNSSRFMLACGFDA